MQTKILSLLIALSIVTSACGPASEWVKIKINPGIPQNKSAPNLLEEWFDVNKSLSAFVGTATSSRCIQNKIFVGYSESLSGGGFKGVPTQMSTAVLENLSSVGPTAAQFISIAQFGFDVPIALNVPKGKQIRVGIMGLMSATDITDGPYCGIPSTKADEHYLPFMGKSPVITIVDQKSVDISVQMVAPTETPDPAKADGFNRFTSGTMTATTATGCGGPNCNISITYGGETSKGEGVEQLISSTGGWPTTLNFTVPRMYPLITKMYNNGVLVATGKICKSTVNGMPGQSTDPSATHTPNLSFAGSGGALIGGDCTTWPGGD